MTSEKEPTMLLLFVLVVIVSELQRFDYVLAYQHFAQATACISVTDSRAFLFAKLSDLNSTQALPAGS